ncbi:Hypothetical protein CFV354_0559 [Campylobacter fetus subsp. venerealis NCTC 10354]|nr:Hypothetical protein CFV354_0559 [Campylobacter fetus subsp. venerealis NCTC 10354]
MSEVFVKKLNEVKKKCKNEKIKLGLTIKIYQIKE